MLHKLKFMSNKLGKLQIIDKILFLVIFFSMWIFSPVLVVISMFILMIPYLFLTKRKSLLPQLAVAFTLSFIWIFVANGKYGYANESATLFGLNLFPMFGWTMGLFTFYLVFSHYEHLFKKNSFLPKFFTFSLFFFLLVIATEAISYHIFGIQNLSNGEYEGLPICNCLHAPFWMQLAYFIMGPFYYLICHRLKLKNPHLKLKYTLTQESKN